MAVRRSRGWLLNRLLRPLGVMLVPRPYSSAKALHEDANVTEVHHPSRGGESVRWIRRVADLAERSERGGG